MQQDYSTIRRKKIQPQGVTYLMDICKDLSNRLQDLEFGKCEDPRRKSLIQCSCKVVCGDLSAFYILCCFYCGRGSMQYHERQSSLAFVPDFACLSYVQFIMFNSLCPARRCSVPLPHLQLSGSMKTLTWPFPCHGINNLHLEETRWYKPNSVAYGKLQLQAWARMSWPSVPFR